MTQASRLTFERCRWKQGRQCNFWISQIIISYTCMSCLKHLPALALFYYLPHISGSTFYRSLLYYGISHSFFAIVTVFDVMYCTNTSFLIHYCFLLKKILYQQNKEKNAFQNDFQITRDVKKRINELETK